MKANIKLGLFRLIPTALLTLIRHVIAQMTGNPNFTTPAVTMLIMGQLADKLEGAIEAAINGTQEDRLFRDEVVVECQDMLRIQADYVRTICAGNAVKLASSGFSLMKQREPIGVPVAPPEFSAAMTGKPGEIEVRLEGVRGAHAYHIWGSETDPMVNANWKVMAYTTRVKHKLTGLASYKPLYLRATALGVAGESAPSAHVVACAA